MPNLIDRDSADGLRVLMLSFEYPPKAGAGTHVHELIRGLSRLDCQTVLLAPTTGNSQSYRESGAQVHLVSPSAETCARVARLSKVEGVLEVNRYLVRRARSLIVDEGLQPHLIHCHDWYTWLAARELRQAFGLPVIGTAHSTSEPIVRWWGESPDPEVLAQERDLYLNADALITVSHSMCSLIRAAYGTPGDRLHVVYNGLGFDSFFKSNPRPPELEQLRGTLAEAGEKLIIFAGRLTRQKGIEALLAAAAHLLGENHPVRLLLAGEPDSRSSAIELERLLNGHAEFANKITVLGKIQRKQLAFLYQVADIAVVPSVYEPFGYAAIEAMASGVPVVATNVGGLPEIITHHRTGLLVPVRQNETGRQEVDVSALVSALRRLVCDEALGKRLAAAARQSVSERFDLDEMARRTFRIYRQYADGFRRMKP